MPFKTDTQFKRASALMYPKNLMLKSIENIFLSLKRMTIILTSILALMKYKNSSTRNTALLSLMAPKKRIKKVDYLFN